MKKILFLIVILILAGMWFFIPKFIGIPKEVQIIDFDKNTSIDMTLPKGSHYFFSLSMERNTAFDGELKVLKNSKIIYKTNIKNNKTSNSSEYYNLIPRKKALNLFQENEKYNFIFIFYKQPSNNMSFMFDYLSHW